MTDTAQIIEAITALKPGRKIKFETAVGKLMVYRHRVKNVYGICLDGYLMEEHPQLTDALRATLALIESAKHQ
jgi:hypothetical protein